MYVLYRKMFVKIRKVQVIHFQDNVIFGTFVIFEKKNFLNFFKKFFFNFGSSAKSDSHSVFYVARSPELPLF